MPRRRVIYDCNVLLQALLSRKGASFRCIQRVWDGNVTLILSTTVLGEVRRILAQPFVVAKNPEITQRRIEAFLTELVFRAEVVRDVPRMQALQRDPKDACYLDLAVAAEVEFIVTRDRDLLDLPQDHSLDAKQFRQLSRNRIQILDPQSFLAEIGPTP
jgi:uncharacterized protein